MSAHLQDLLRRSDRRILGFMSGTSLDGIDVADVRISGTGPGLKWSVSGFYSQSYSPGVRDALLRNSQPVTARLNEITVLDDLIAQEYESAATQAFATWGTSAADYDAVGMHGQTLFHQPVPLTVAGREYVGTYQAGSPSVLASRLGIPVVGDFRVADMAFGGQGAPLVPYFDFVTFSNQAEARLLVNIGGISNITFLPAGTGIEGVRAFDTGPGNVLLDGAAKSLLGLPMDEGGRMALQGSVHAGWLAEMMADPWFATPPPRSTGRELFSQSYLDRILARATGFGLAVPDVLATLAAFTAASIADGASEFNVDRILVSGGGVHNRALMDQISHRFAPVPVETTAEFGLDPDAKEAVCFAVLAHEFLCGTPTGVPGATGARRPALLGQLAMPSP